MAEPDAAYAALLQTIKPRGRFADLLHAAAASDDEPDDGSAGEESDSEQGNSADEEADADSVDINAELESGDDDADGASALGSESEPSDLEEPELATDESESYSESEAEEEPAPQTAVRAEDESEGQLRNANLREHFGIEFDDKGASRFEKLLAAAQKDPKAKQLPAIELESPSFGTAIVVPGFGAFTKNVDVARRVACKQLRPNLRWWTRKDEGAAKPEGEHLDLTPLQAELFGYLDAYKDVVLPQWTFETATEIREAYVLHALNHALKARAIVQKNDERVKAAAAAGREVEARDQGFTRPRVLIVVPYRFCALKIVQLMIRLLIDPSGNKVERSVKSQNRFFEEYGVDADEPDEENEHLRQQFDGNADDCFRVGITLNKSSLNLYTKLNFSDIIIASPLGLRLVIGTDEKKTKEDFDFLSSIELLVFDQVVCVCRCMPCSSVPDGLAADAELVARAAHYGVHESHSQGAARGGHWADPALEPGGLGQVLPPDRARQHTPGARVRRPPRAPVPQRLWQGSLRAADRRPVTRAGDTEQAGRGRHLPRGEERAAGVPTLCGGQSGRAEPGAAGVLPGGAAAQAGRRPSQAHHDIRPQLL